MISLFYYNKPFQANTCHRDMDQDYPTHPYLYEQNKLDTLTIVMLNATHPSTFSQSD